MPARGGGGYAALKWVTSFPGNPERGLPTVSGIVLLSDAADGRLLAQLDAGAVRRSAPARPRCWPRRRSRRARAALVVGCGVNGRAVARTFLARDVLLWDADVARAAAVAEELGARAAGSRKEALGADVVATVTPGREILFPRGGLRAGTSASWAPTARARRRSPSRSSREPGSSSTSGAGQPQRRHLPRRRGGNAPGAEDVTELGRILLGEAGGRAQADEITVFDSTGLAVQDLAVARSCTSGTAPTPVPTRSPAWSRSRWRRAKSAPGNAGSLPSGRRSLPGYPPYLDPALARLAGKPTPAPVAPGARVELRVRAAACASRRSVTAAVTPETQ